jgi:hypothetical protein
VFIGVANAPVQKQDRFLIPQSYNPEYDHTRETPYFRALVLRQTQQCYGLVGFAYLIPLFAYVYMTSFEPVSETNSDHKKTLDSFGFSLQDLTISLA